MNIERMPGINGDDRPDEIQHQGENLPAEQTDQGKDVPAAKQNERYGSDQENNEAEYKEYLLKRFEEIFNKNLETVKEYLPTMESLHKAAGNSGPVITDQIKINILLNSLKELADDPNMPPEQSKLLKTRIAIQDMELPIADINTKGSPYHGAREVSDGFQISKKRMLIEQLGEIFPEDFVRYIKSL